MRTINPRVIRDRRADALLRVREPVRVLMVSEGSGGHLIPALEVARALARSGASVELIYARRSQAAELFEALLEDGRSDGIAFHPITLKRTSFLPLRGAQRAWQAVGVWREASARIKRFRPHAVVGFGGWISVPVVVAARERRLPVMLHEQNVRLGRANRFLVRWATQMAISFDETVKELNGTPRVLTGLPIRPAIGAASRDEAARQYGFDASSPTVLILGGSQGARAVNRLMTGLLPELSDDERRAWQFIHLTGAPEHDAVQQAYAATRARAHVVPYLADMATAYAMADVVVARAGASTISELAFCGKPAILIPYPYAGGHQRENAKVVEAAGAGVWMNEETTTPAQALTRLRQIMRDPRVRGVMGYQMRALAKPDATQRIADAVIQMVQRHAER